MSAVVEGRRKGLFRRGSAAADASVDAPIAPEKGKKSGKKSGKRRGKEKPIGLPQVNLLPDEISDAIKARKILKAAIFVLVLVLAGLAGLWWMQGSAISQAQTTLATAQATQQDLNAKITALQPVTDLYNELTLLQDAVTTSLADQPQASLAFLRLESAAASVPGAPIEITQVSTSYQGIPEPGGTLNPCPNPDPFGAEITVGLRNGDRPRPGVRAPAGPRERPAVHRTVHHLHIGELVHGAGPTDRGELLRNRRTVPGDPRNTADRGADRRDRQPSGTRN